MDCFYGRCLRKCLWRLISGRVYSVVERAGLGWIVISMVRRIWNWQILISVICGLEVGDEVWGCVSTLDCFPGLLFRMGGLFW